MALRIKRVVLNNALLLTTILIFILVYFMGGQLYPAMQKPQVFFNLLDQHRQPVDCCHRR